MIKNDQALCLDAAALSPELGSFLEKCLTETLSTTPPIHPRNFENLNFIFYEILFLLFMLLFELSAETMDRYYQRVYLSPEACVPAGPG